MNGDWLAERFEEDRPHLRSIAYRMLGSPSEADDAVQEAWLRLSRSDTSDVENLSGWLTTVVSRVCLDMLRARKSRREEPSNLEAHELAAEPDGGPGPEDEVLMGDSIGMALLVVLQTLTPAERVAFVLHDMFAVPFDEIAPVVGRTPDATRQLASRARRRVQGASVPEGDITRQRRLVEAFLAASREGDLEALIAVLDPDVVVGADNAAVEMGASREVRGAQAVVETFAGRARAARFALVNGVPGAVWLQKGAPRVVFAFRTETNSILSIEMIADPDRIAEMDISVAG